MPEKNDYLAEVRESRMEISELCEHDPVKCVEYLKSFNRQFAAQVQHYRQQQGRDRTQAARTG